MAFSETTGCFEGVDHAIPNGPSLWAKQIEGCRNYHIIFGFPMGAESDPTGQEGIAHFTEHIVFRGGKRFPSLLSMREHLTIFGGFPNARTTRQWVSYEISVPPELLLRGLEVISSLVFDVEFNDIELERLIIQQEMLELKNWLSKFSNTVLSAALTRSPGWQHLPVGTPDSLKRITEMNLRDFYSRWYIPQNLSAVIVGPRSEEVMLEALINSVGRLSSYCPAIELLPTPSIEGGTEAAYKWNDWDLNFTTAMLGYAAQLPLKDEVMCIARLILRVLNGSENSPLPQILREEMGLIYDMGSGLGCHRGFNEISFDAYVNQCNIDMLGSAFEKIVLDEDHYTSSRAKRVRLDLMEELRRESLSSLDIAREKIESMLLGRNILDADKKIEILKAMNPDEMLAFAREYLSPEKWRKVSILPN